jgi:acetyl esterase
MSMDGSVARGAKAAPSTERRLDPELAQLLPKLPLRDSRALTPSIAREQLIALARSRNDVPLPQPAAVADLTIPGAAGPLAARLYRPARMPAPTVVYFHGGGWVAGDLSTHDRQARLLAIEVEAVVLSIDYRRPPETKFPGAFDDGLAAARWAAANIAALGGDAARLGVAGDSAGANLAAAVAQACREEGPQLAAQLLIYPAVDAAGNYRSEAENAKYPSRAQNAESYFLTLDTMQWFADRYLRDARDGLDPRASPLRSATFAGLPPTVLCTAEFDPLRDEGEAYARALQRAGVRVAYSREPTLIHGFFGMGNASAAAAAAGRRIRAAFKAVLEMGAGPA